MSTGLTPCPLCGSSAVTTKVDTIGTRNGVIETHYATCDECGSEINPDDDDLFVVNLIED
jgi:formate dehydrogenase maturation protein FdhE